MNFMKFWRLASKVFLKKINNKWYVQGKLGIISLLKISKNIFYEIELLKFQIYNFINYRNVEVFGNIGIETHTLCNRKCKHCPVAYYPRNKVKMSGPIFQRIIDQLAEKTIREKLTFIGIMSPF